MKIGEKRLKKEEKQRRWQFPLYSAVVRAPRELTRKWPSLVSGWFSCYLRVFENGKLLQGRHSHRRRHVQRWFSTLQFQPLLRRREGSCLSRSPHLWSQGTFSSTLLFSNSTFNSSFFFFNLPSSIERARLSVGASSLERKITGGGGSDNSCVTKFHRISSVLCVWLMDFLCSFGRLWDWRTRSPYAGSTSWGHCCVDIRDMELISFLTL